MEGRELLRTEVAISFVKDTFSQQLKHNLNLIPISHQLVYWTLQSKKQYPAIKAILPDTITFISSEELLQKYPAFTPKERENAITKEFGAVFLYGIGGELSNGTAHDGRAADYDDWSSANENGYNGLNGDILVWNPVLNSAFELSSMGIRVRQKSIEYQRNRNNTERVSYFHKMLLDGHLPESIGGGIGQSRVVCLCP
ncbi:hypothetical protein FQR65_LT16758 [Abscondita terminalis]|nr:hypothetical protein FQR65_LT16758 [Abscondita terminalis]